MNPIDLGVIVAYFAVVTAVGFWASRKVHTDEDFFLGGRRFGKGLLIMHWLCTGTHSEMAVQVTGAVARVGLGGIWYQWMFLFSTPFYWMIAPIVRRLRVISTGDFFRIRYGVGLEMLYSVVGLLYLVLSVAMLLRGAAAAIEGGTGGLVTTEQGVLLLAILFSTYVVAGGLMAAAYTDYLQGVLIIVLSLLLIPAGLAHVGGWQGLRAALPSGMFSITAPRGAPEGDIWFVVAQSLLGLTGVIAQPHVMNANGSGKTELEARVGMCYGNFIKRLLTLAWAVTGLIAVAHFAPRLTGLSAEEARATTEKLFGQAIREWLGTGWRGLMIACLIAGVTSAETFMVVGAGLVSRNFYRRLVPGRSDRHYLWSGRCASVGILLAGIVVAARAGSIAQLFLVSNQMIGLMGAAFWLGVVWRRANAIGAWSSFFCGVLVWGLTALDESMVVEGTLAGNLIVGCLTVKSWLGLADMGRPFQILVMLGSQLLTLIVVSLLTRPLASSRLDAFFARLHTPVGTESKVSRPPRKGENLAEIGIGLDGILLDYSQASRDSPKRLQSLGLELPRFTPLDVGGFLAAWVVVFLMIGLLAIVAW